MTSANGDKTGTDGSVTTLEDTAYIFKAADFGFTDPNDSPANALFAVEITTLPAACTFFFIIPPPPTSPLFPYTTLFRSHLVFAPAANANGNGYASLTFQVQDNGGTA